MTISEELKENIRNLGSYYGQHKLEKMVESHQGFVTEDFAELLTALHIELEIDVNAKKVDF